MFCVGVFAMYVVLLFVGVSVDTPEFMICPVCPTYGHCYVHVLLFPLFACVLCIYYFMLCF